MRSSEPSYHTPVLLRESVRGLITDASGVYVDVTFGGGGHAREILAHLDADAKLIGFDQDADAAANVPQDDRFVFVNANFRYLKRFLKLHGHVQVDGVLADLGVSSHQFDEKERGFSYRYDAPLDMRMNSEADQTAADVLATYTTKELQQMLSKYGEIRNAKTLAAHLVDVQRHSPISTTGQLVEAIAPYVRGKRMRYLSQVFQALRMEVNQELAVLEQLLLQAASVLRPGGRLSIISYHSLEDRAVKNFFKFGNTDGRAEKDFYGNLLRNMQPITKKPVLPTDDEIQQNSRARSAKLRIAEKTES